MAKAVDLSHLRNKPAAKAPEPEQDALFDLTPEQEAEIAERAAAQEPADERTPVVTAFVVFQRHDGAWEAHADLAIADTLALARQAHQDDFLAGSANITKDVSAMVSAQHVMGIIQAQAQRAQQQMMSQQQGQSAMAGIDLSKLRA